MQINFVHIRPSEALEKRYAAISKIDDISAVGIVLGECFDVDTLKELSKIVVKKGVRLVSVYGEQAEMLHDLVDREALSRRQTDEVITTFAQVETISEFVRTVYFVYRGVLNTPDQDRGTIICFISDNRAVPEELENAIEKIKNTSLPVRNGASDSGA